MLLQIKNQKGFTLIELLIVIAIIGILATIATVSLGASQQRARDAQRKSDLKQVANALEIYFQNNGTGGTYPAPSGIGITGVTGCLSSNWGAGCTWTNYMRVVPDDPLSTSGKHYCYTSASPFTAYNLYATLENSNDPEKGTYAADGSCSGYNYRLQSPF